MWQYAACLFGSYMLVDNMLTEDTTWKFTDGYVKVPDSPGLGVEVSDEALKKYCENVITVTDPMK
jgi:L-alanine-DL-glutamate epimerase-like enolase superfamily enzyme